MFFDAPISDYNDTVRIDRLVGKWGGWGKRRTREYFENGQIRLNGEVTEERGILVGKFDHIEVAGEVVQAFIKRTILLHKPVGVVSATTDPEHQTVIDLITEDWAKELHLAGRLDRFTTGLVILTNDSSFSESLTEPGQKVGKRYLVTVDGEITPQVIAAFEKGMWFAKEKITTAPAVVELLDERKCRLTIYEGKHHQIKRMFARFDLKVTALHREAIGGIELPDDLKEGDYRILPELYG